MADKDEVTYYELLGLNKDCSDKEITRAYRKKALKCHPDKNPDNPNAAELFHKLNTAFEVIGNPKARAAYDATLKAKERVRLRTQAYDSKRKKFKEDLEQREKLSQEDYVKEEVLVRNLEQEIERLREEGLKLLQREQQLMKEKIEEEKKRMAATSTAQDNISETPKLKIHWKSQKNNDKNGGYSQELLYSMFQKYGEIENLLVSSKKKGSAIVEFKEFKSAEMAVENELGNPANPLKISWLQGGPHNRPRETSSRETNMPQNETLTAQDTGSLTSELDFESLVMRKLRQEEERKRLIEQIAKEETEGS